MRGAAATRLPVRRPPPTVRRRARDRRGRQRRLDAAVDALLPPPTSLSLVQLGAAITIANLAVLPVVPVIGSLVDRFGPKQVLQAGNACAAVAFLLYLFAALLRRRRGPRLRGGRHPVRVLGRPRADGHADHRAGGAGAVVRLPPGAAQRRLRLGGVLAAVALTIGSEAAFQSVVPAQRRVVRRGVRADARRRRRPRRRRGRGARRRQQPRLVGRRSPTAATAG